jgi:hypothetical protein
VEAGSKQGTCVGSGIGGLSGVPAGALGVKRRAGRGLGVFVTDDLV